MQLFWVTNKAVNFAEKHLGPNDGITENLRNVYENARSELDPNFKKKKTTGKKRANDDDKEEDHKLEMEGEGEIKEDEDNDENRSPEQIDDNEDAEGEEEN